MLLYRLSDLGGQGQELRPFRLGFGVTLRHLCRLQGLKEISLLVDSGARFRDPSRGIQDCGFHSLASA